MRLQDILLEKLPGGVKAKMLELNPKEPGQWRFILRLTDPVLKDVKMKWGYITTALDSEDFDKKQVSNYYNDFKTQVLNKADEWVFVTKKAPQKRTYGIRQVIEAEVFAIPKKTKRNTDPNDLSKISDVELNTKNMKMLDRVRNIELFEMPAKYPYEVVQSSSAEKPETATKTDQEPGGSTEIETGGGENNDTNQVNTTTTGLQPVSYDRSKINTINPAVQEIQKLIIDKFSNILGNVAEFNKFKRYGADGKFGPTTHTIIKLIQGGFSLPVTGNIDAELIKKLGSL